jgi:hypothetical protein
MESHRLLLRLRLRVWAAARRRRTPHVQSGIMKTRHCRECSDFSDTNHRAAAKGLKVGQCRWVCVTVLIAQGGRSAGHRRNHRQGDHVAGISLRESPACFPFKFTPWKCGVVGS